MNKSLFAIVVFVVSASCQTLPGIEGLAFGMSCKDVQLKMERQQIKPLDPWSNPCSLVRFSDYPWQGSSYLLDMKFANEHFESFVLTREALVNSVGFREKFSSFMNGLTLRYGYPDGGFVLSPDSLLNHQFPIGKPIDLAEWMRKPYLYKVTIIHTDDGYVWSFSGAKALK